MSPYIQSLRLPALSLLTALALTAPVMAQVAIDPPTKLSVSPNPGPADKAFTLTLIGAAAGCSNAFTRETVTVTGKRIDLSYTATSVVYGIPEAADAAATGKESVICPVVLDQANPDVNVMIPIYNAPTFQMPALKAGDYEVFATNKPECLYAAPACRLAVQAVSAGTLTIAPVVDPVVKYTVTPTSIGASQDFDIHLLSYQFNCGTTFDNLSSSVAGNVITLSFQDHEQTGIACPAIYAPYGPTFHLAGLKAGTYTVNAYRQPACYPTCKMLGETTAAGTLTVGPAVARKGWFLKNGQTLAGKAFSLDLQNNSLGSCQSSFSHKSVSADGGNIYTTFLVETDAQRVCIVDLRPFGPSFDMAALKVGVYPVYVTEMLQCQVVAPFCAVKLMPVLSDTLVVTQTVSVLISELRANSPKVEMHGSRAAFILPDGIGGTWTAELMTVSGQRLSIASVQGEGGSTAEFDLGSGLQRGVYIVRLLSPDGETHMLPLVRNR